jgi:hypothetical protein
VQVPPPKEIADAMRHEGVELATDAGLRYKGGGGAIPSAAAGMLTAGAPVGSLPAAAATMVKRSAPEAETSLPQKIFKREPEQQQQLLGFDFCGRGDEEGEGEEVLGLTGSCSSEMEEGGRSSRQDFSLPSIMAAEIPGLDELMASESKSDVKFPVGRRLRGI